MPAEWMMQMLGGFSRPMDIGTTPESLLWMFPLLAAIAIVYKATKLRVLFWGKFVKETLILFLTVSVFMVITGVGLNILVRLLTS